MCQSLGKRWQAILITVILVSICAPLPSFSAAVSMEYFLGFNGFVIDIECYPGLGQRLGPQISHAYKDNVFRLSPDESGRSINFRHCQVRVFLVADLDTFEGNTGAQTPGGIDGADGPPPEIGNQNHCFIRVTGRAQGPICQAQGRQVAGGFKPR